MLKKIVFAIAAASAALGASSAAFAHDRDRDRDRDHRWGRAWDHERYVPRYYAPRPFFVVPAPRVVYAPPPRVAYPYYAAPVYAPAPRYSAPSVSIHFVLPL